MSNNNTVAVNNIIKKIPDGVLEVLNLEADNQMKIDALCKILNEYNVDFTQLKIRENRCDVQIDGYTVKFAFNEIGRKDNEKEFITWKVFSPYVLECYNSIGNYMIMICSGYTPL